MASNHLCKIVLRMADEARKWKIWQSGIRPPACDTMIERLTGDSQMDVEVGFRALLEKIIEQTLDKVPWINLN
jgi:hypothetical protein